MKLLLEKAKEEVWEKERHEREQVGHSLQVSENSYREECCGWL